MIILTEKETEVSFFKYFILWPCSMWNLSFPNPGLDPAPPTLDMQSINHWTAREISPQIISDTRFIPVTQSA